MFIPKALSSWTAFAGSVHDCEAVLLEINIGIRQQFKFHYPSEPNI